MAKRGRQALDQVLETISRELMKTPEGRELLNQDSNIRQRLTYAICRDLGVVCKYIDKGLGDDWMLACDQAPRGRGYCLYHYRKKFMKYVFEEASIKNTKKGKEKVKNKIRYY